MADTSILGRALMEAGRQLSLSSQNAGGGSGAAPIPPSTKGYHPAAVDPAQALLPKIDLLNKKMSTVEGLLSAQPDAIVQVRVRALFVPVLFRLPSRIPL